MAYRIRFERNGKLFQTGIIARKSTADREVRKMRKFLKNLEGDIFPVSRRNKDWKTYRVVKA